MPTIHREGPYRFSFYSRENAEPPHVHVFAGKSEAKFWIEPVALASSDGFSAKQIRDSLEIVRKRQSSFLEQWYGFFARDG